MSDAPISPLFAHRPFVGLLTVGEMAARLAEPGVPLATLESRLRYWAKLRLVHVRERRGSGSTAANLFDWADLGVAKVLSELSELGIADTAVLEAASRGLYSQPAGSPERSGVIAAAKGHRRGEWWTFQLDTWRHLETGERRIIAGAVQPLKGEHLKSLDRTMNAEGEVIVTPLSDLGFVLKAAIMMELPTLLGQVYGDRPTVN